MPVRDFVIQHANIVVIQLSRYILGLTWIYHGIFPKLLTIAPLEQAMMATLNLSASHEWMVIKLAGVLEVVFGLLLLIYYRSARLQWLNIAALIILLILSSMSLPRILIEAFNPVTTNIPLIGLSLIIYILSSKQTAETHH